MEINPPPPEYTAPIVGEYYHYQTRGIYIVTETLRYNGIEEYTLINLETGRNWARLTTDISEIFGKSQNAFKRIEKIHFIVN